MIIMYYTIKSEHVLSCSDCVVVFVCVCIGHGMINDCTRLAFCYCMPKCIKYYYKLSI